MSESLVKLQKNKNITLPTWLIRRFRMEPGDYLRIEQTAEGVVLRPARLIDPSQAYSWTEEWQAGEREAQADIAAGRTAEFDDVAALIADLED